MSEFQQRDSGLIVPVPAAPPKTAGRTFSVLEVESPKRREKVSKAMLDLWKALELSSFRKLDCPRDASNHKDHMRLYRFVGQSLLGDDCPILEELC